MKIAAISPKGEALPATLAKEKDADAVDAKIKTCSPSIVFSVHLEPRANSTC